ncbi:WhiB family transcriptional regulator [Mycobacterium intracellulare]|uniref:WhiB family transcriptional regulator n=1 Tax=Mycobacterium intracellulare TaxID=1767 RepID=UPI00398ADD75
MRWCAIRLWDTATEWRGYANCRGDERFTAERLTAQDIVEVQQICGQCRVRPECIEWALQQRASAVIVAGAIMPDPQFKKSLRRVHRFLRDRLPYEREARGEDI